MKSSIYFLSHGISHSFQNKDKWDNTHIWFSQSKYQIKDTLKWFQKLILFGYHSNGYLCDFVLDLYKVLSIIMSVQLHFHVVTWSGNARFQLTAPHTIRTERWGVGTHGIGTGRLGNTVRALHVSEGLSLTACGRALAPGADSPMYGGFTASMVTFAHFSGFCCHVTRGWFDFLVGYAMDVGACHPSALYTATACHRAL